MEAGTGEKLQDCDVDNRRRRYSITAQHASHAHPIHILDNAGATKVRTWHLSLALPLTIACVRGGLSLSP